jgi:hypothetical protein
MTQYARPDSDVSNNGSWDLSDGSDLYALIDESSTDDSDYVSVSDPGDADFIVGLSDVTDPSSAADHKVYYRASDDSDGDGALTVVLLETTTARATSLNEGMSASLAQYTFTLSSAEANSISNYNNLRLSFSANDEMAMGLTVKVTQAWFQCPDDGGGAGADAVPVSLNTYRQMREN